MLKKSELSWSQLTNIGGDIIPWLVSKYFFEHFFEHFWETQTYLVKTGAGQPK